MKKKVGKLIGLKFDDFQNFVEEKQIKLSQARLIPLLKMGDEMALTSIFLSSLRIVKEFKEMFFKDSGISRVGKTFFFTEVCFPELSESRIDGMLLVVSAGKIKDAAFFEMKNKSNDIEIDQIKKYSEVAKKLGVPKIITVSNQFVSEPSKTPYDLKSSRSLTYLHFSWTYLLTLSKILLHDNETNISDSDQIELMKEIVAYLVLETKKPRFLRALNFLW